jgi:hypothetical protein
LGDFEFSGFPKVGEWRANLDGNGTSETASEQISSLRRGIIGAIVRRSRLSKARGFTSTDRRGGHPPSHDSGEVAPVEGFVFVAIAAGQLKDTEAQNHGAKYNLNHEL